MDLEAGASHGGLLHFGAAPAVLVGACPYSIGPETSLPMLSSPYSKDAQNRLQRPARSRRKTVDQTGPEIAGGDRSRLCGDQTPPAPQSPTTARPALTPAPTSHRCLDSPARPRARSQRAP